MTSSKRKILILGDELGLSEQISKALQAEGFDVKACMRGPDAMDILRTGDVQYAFVDCMLPGSENGVEFISNARKTVNLSNVKFFLMSGLFTDKEFIKDALHQTKALQFIEKKHPFDVGKILSILQENQAMDAVPIRKKLYQMFSKEKVSNREKRKLIESLEEVNGFDLPFIYSLLVETRSSGYLNIYEKEGGVSGVSFSDGCIVGVDAEDKTTVLGEMLIQSGYVTPQSVQNALKERSNQKMGARLINANLLSPHAFDLILMEQMNIRLSRTVADHMVKLNFASTEVERTHPYIDSDRLQFYLHDWIAAKIETSWLKSLYVLWSGHELLLSPNFKDDHPALEMALVQAMPDLVKKIREGHVTLTQLLDLKRYPEAAVYKAVHFLLTKGLITFGTKQAFSSGQDQHVALKRLWSSVQGKNVYEIIDMVGIENLESEALDALMGSKPTDETSPMGVLWVNLRKKMDDASAASRDTQGRAKFNEDAAMKMAEVRMKVRQRLDEARQKLGLNQFSAAAAILQDVQRQLPQAEGLHLLMAWAKTGTITPTQKVNQLKDIEFELLQVSAEEKYDAHYSMVMGLFQKAKGDLQGAKKSLEKAVAMNSSLITARRELSQVETQLKKSGDLFSGLDFKSMVSGIFRKK